MSQLGLLSSRSSLGGGLAAAPRCSQIPVKHLRRAVQAATYTTTTTTSVSTIARPSLLITAGPATQEPDYAAIDAHPVSRIVQALFRRKMVHAIGEDVQEQGYDGIIALTRKLISKYESLRETQIVTVRILMSLFPSWLLPSFRVLFAKPFPEFSSRMSAVATALSCEWLMGKVTVNDVEVDGGKIAAGQGVLVERCRYLEQAGCASICINSCKVPTQEFFAKEMALPLTMTPNYEDFSCQFSFGKTPEPQASDAAFSSPCFAQCPSKRKATRKQGQTQCPGVAANA